MAGKPFVVLVVSSRTEIDATVRDALATEGAELSVARDVASTLRALEEGSADLVIVDSPAQLGESLELVRAVQERWPGMPVVLLAESAEQAQIAEALAAGAADLLVRPLSSAQLVFSVRKALATVRRSVCAPPPPRAHAGLVFGRSPAMQSLRELLEQVAPTSSTVLVRGESGTGKELVARALHRASPRAERPFIKIDCTSLPENLIESELFGYEKGAFTGAVSMKPGRVQLADTGTLFLDEIGELPLTLQSKLLRLLQDREFERLGGKQTLRVDLRLIAATHRDLETMVERSTFRQDLFYRLNVVPLWIAPLRARRADIPELARHFCDEMARAQGKPGVHFAADALGMLSGQRWPGNVRQLQNFVERLVVLCKTDTITEADIRAEVARPVRFATETGPAGADSASEPDGGPGEARDSGPALDQAVRAAERAALQRALLQAQGNRSAAARLLGISRSTLYLKLDEHGLLGKG